MDYIPKENEIDEIQSFKTAMNLCERCKIDASGLKTIENFKERLHLFRRNETIENYNRSCSAQRIENAFRKFAENKKELISLLEGVNKSIFQGLEPELVDIVEIYDEQYLENMNKYISRLRSVECPILIAGEVSAGKSTLINLILGESLLPVGHLHTTTCVSKLRYSTNRCINLFTWNANDKKLKSGKEINIDNISDMAATIENAMKSMSKASTSTNRGAKSGGSFQSNRDNKTYEETPMLLASISADDVDIACDDADDLELASGKLTIQWDFPFLKDGILLVDSPGIGETSLATEQVMKYLPNACSIIYVIDVSNAGGMKEDRLIRLITEAQNLNTEKFHLFSPESAIFVCNKWDTIAREDQHDVENCIKEKLKRLWPGFRESQLILLSSTNVINHLKAGFVSDEWKSLHCIIAQLIEDSLKKIITNSSCWFYSLLGVIANRYRFISRCSYLNDAVRISYLKSLKNNTISIKSTLKNPDFHGDIVKTIDDRTKQIANSLRIFLDCDDFRNGMTTWILEDIPIREKVADQDIKELICILFSDRFIRLLTLWEKKHGLLRQFQDDIKISLDARYGDVFLALANLENLLQINDDSFDCLYDLNITSSLGEISLRLDVTPPNVTKSWRNFYTTFGITTGAVGGGVAGAAIGLTIADGVAAAVIGGVIGGVTGGIGAIISVVVLGVLVGVVWSRNKRNRQRKRILSILQQNAPKILLELAEKQKADEIAQKYANPIKTFVEDIRRKIYQQIEANETFISQTSEKNGYQAKDTAQDKIDIIENFREGVNVILRKYDHDM
ncbi:hypothetical protein TrispH2_008776 [Trichoplax sp. H2]|nr:hypothetical protein TrispH2_008776 [Trichoplax sp. H2]|eukprot:RDD39491.1 hypothetical protein TrispH2_008776 [Trichoplax sp. H2]